MTFSELIAVIDQLKAEKSSLDGLYEIRISKGGHLPIYFGIESPSGLIEFSVIAPKGLYKLINPESTKGFKIEFMGESPREDVFKLNISLTSNEFYDQFLVVALDLLNVLLSDEDPRSSFTSFANRLDHWRNFLKNSSSKKLTHEEEVGLIGELIILKSLIISNQADNPLLHWTGPIGASHDFEYGSTSYEVKASTAKNKSTVNISSEFQLEADSGELYLIHVRLKEGADSTVIFSLPDLVLDIEKLLPPHLVEQFNALLACIGYFRVDREKYLNSTYIFEGASAYEVNEGFPKITFSSIDRSISKVKYSLNLKGLQEVEKNPLINLKNIN